MITYNGMAIITDSGLTDIKYEFVRRTWKERLFSWPWDPWMHLKYISYTVPSTKIYRLNHAMIMHPVMAQRLRDLDGKNTTDTFVFARRHKLNFGGPLTHISMLAAKFF